jgi:hypothetical protein
MDSRLIGNKSTPGFRPHNLGDFPYHYTRTSAPLQDPGPRRDPGVEDEEEEVSQLEAGLWSAAALAGQGRPPGAA